MQFHRKLLRIRRHGLTEEMLPIDLSALRKIWVALRIWGKRWAECTQHNLWERPHGLKRFPPSPTNNMFAGVTVNRGGFDDGERSEGDDEVGARLSCLSDSPFAPTHRVIRTPTHSIRIIHRIPIPILWTSHDQHYCLFLYVHNNANHTNFSMLSIHGTKCGWPLLIPYPYNSPPIIFCNPLFHS